MTVAERVPTGYWRSGFALAAFLVLVLAVAVTGSIITETGQDWYDDLEQPGFTPPGWAFGAVWTPLYVLIGISGWRLWANRDSGTATLALTLWGVQLALNLGWTLLFFGAQAPGAALVEIGVLFVAIAATIVAAWPVSKLAAALLVPYLAWVGFATALNFEFWRLN